MKRNLIPMVGITDCNLAEAEVSHLNQQLQYLVQVIQQLTAAHDLNHIMAAVRIGARRLTNADGATFVLREGDQCYYADEDAISPLWKGGRFPMSTCISGWVMLNQQSVIIEDIYADPRIPADAYRPTFVKSLAMVPIRTRNPIGAIGNYWATRHTPTAEEMELLQTLADAAAVAIENVYLYEKQEQRLQEHTAQLQRSLNFEALLRRITDKVRDSLDERQILATVVQELSQGLGLTRCHTTLYNLEQGTITVCYEYKHPDLTVACRQVAVMADFPELYGQLLQKEPSQFCPLPQSPISLAPEPESLILACPIVEDQRVLGDIRLYRPAAEPFTELEVRLVQQVSNQCAIALRQAHLHEAVQAQVNELERLHQLKDDFLSRVSHELRTPMTNIRMAVQMLKSVLGLLDLETHPAIINTITLSQVNFTKVVKYLEILSQECQRETNLINNLLDLNRLESEKTVEPGQDIVLQDWIPKIVEPFRERIQQQKQHLQIQIPNDLPPLKTNLAILERILTELLQNACKYTPPKGQIIVSVTICASKTIALALSNPPISYRLTVSNSGATISDDDRVLIFDKFYRIPNDDPWKNGGTGLGLALVKRFVEQLNGAIEVTSENNFVHFTVTLPAAP